MSLSDKQKYIFSEVSIWKTMFYICLPAVFGMVILGFYNFADRLLATSLVSDPTSTLKAMSLSSPVFLFMNAMGALFSLGGATRFGVAIGAKKYTLARKIVGNTITASLLIGITMTIFMWFFQGEFVKWQSAGTLNAITSQKATDYNRYIILGFVPLIFSWIFSNFLRQEGRPITAMVITFLPAFLNVLLDYVFMGPMHMGIKGAAIATSVDQTFQALLGLSLVVFVFKESQLRIQLSDLYIDPVISKMIIIIGLTPFSRYFSLTLTRMTSNIFVTHLHFANGVNAGQYWIYILGGIMPIIFLLFPPAFGFVQGGRAIISFNYGARNYQRVKQTFYLTVFLMFIYLLLVTIILVSIPDKLLMIWKFKENGIQIYDKAQFLDALKHLGNIDLYNKYKNATDNQIISWNGSSPLAHLAGTVYVHPIKDGVKGTISSYASLSLMGLFFGTLTLYQGCGIGKWSFSLSVFRSAAGILMSFFGILIANAKNNIVYYWIFQGPVTTILVAIIAFIFATYLLKRLNKDSKIIIKTNIEDKI